MSTALLKRYIAEVMMSQDVGTGEGDDMNQNVIRKDPDGTGKLVIRKLVTFKKPSSRYAPGEDVDTQLDSNGNAIVDDLEKWEPDYETSKNKPTHSSRYGAGRRRPITRRA
jgi:hypothetical protein